MSLQITQDFDREFYSAYRPILLQVKDLDGTAAYLSAEIQRKITITTTSGFLPTGIICHAYEDYDNPDHYTFNIMGYIRELLVTGTFSKFSQMVTSGFYETGTHFRIVVYANRYSSTPDSPLLTDPIDNVESSPFLSLGTTTDITQELVLNSNATFPHANHLNIDRLILGDNLANGSNDISLRFSQNSPQYNSPNVFVNDAFRSHRASRSYTINRKDSRNDAIYQPVSLDNTWSEFWLTIFIFDNNGDYAASSTIQTFVTQSSLVKIPVHPELLMNYIAVHGGTTGNNIIDANNDLVSSGVAIAPFVKTSGGQVKFLCTPGTFSHTTGYLVDVLYADWSDKQDNGKCNRTKFVFRTSSGGYDWLNIYGTESKNTKFESSTFDKLPSTSMLGESQHARKTLYNDREDTFTVVSQPMSKDVALHCEEMLTSPLVWIEKESKYQHNTTSNLNNGKLVPVLIVPNSFAIYTTESNLQFVEFSYIYSEKITLQKG